MKQARRFVAVGIANAAFTYLLYQLLNVFVIYEIAFTISFATGVLFSAFFNARYSFSIGLGLRALLRFTAVCLISYYLGLQVLIFLRRGAAHPRGPSPPDRRRRHAAVYLCRLARRVDGATDEALAVCRGLTRPAAAVKTASCKACPAGERFSPGVRQHVNSMKISSPTLC